MLEIAAALTVDESLLYEEQILALRLRLGELPTLDRLEVVLPLETRFDVGVGAACTLELNGGDGAHPVFSGELTEVRRGSSGLRVSAHNGGFKLARSRPLVSLEQLSLADVIAQLASDADVDAEVDDDGPQLALYVAEGRSCAHQEIARLADMAGLSCSFDSDGKLRVIDPTQPVDELALLYGREPLQVSRGELLGDGGAIVVVGEGGGEPSSPQGRWVVTDFSRGAASQPGPGQRHLVRPELRTTDDATRAAGAVAVRRDASAKPVRLVTWLHPRLRPGAWLQIAETPDSIGLAECRARQIVSTLRPGKPAISEVWATALPDPGLLSALPSLGDLL